MATPTPALSTPSTKPLEAAASGAVADLPNAKNVTSPGELCGFVDTLLTTLEQRFEDMSEQVLAQMDRMSARIDGLETSISDLMQATEPGSPVDEAR